MALLKNLNTKTQTEREIEASTAGKVQMNLLVTPAFRRKIKQRALDLDTHVNTLIEREMTDYLDRSEESENIARK